MRWLQDLKKGVRTLPDSPGVYLFKNGQAEILQLRRLDRDHAKVNTQDFTVHAKRRQNSACIIELILDGRHVQHSSASRIDVGGSRGNHRVNIARSDSVALHRALAAITI